MVDDKPLKKEQEDYLKDLEDAEKTPTTKEFPFDLLSKKISFLIQAGDILDNHIEELEESLKKVLKERKIPPSSAILYDYIILNINSFYEVAEKKGIPIITLPSKEYVEIFRHNVLAHFFRKKDNAGVVKEYKKIQEVGFLEIYNDWKEFRDKVFLFLNSKMGKKETTEEAIKIKNELHKNFSELLNSGSYKNNQKLSLLRNGVKIEMSLVNGSGTQSLSKDDLKGENTKYHMKIFNLGVSPEPFRIEVDNAHSQAHINNPSTGSRIGIPIENLQNMGYCGSIVFGLTMNGSQLKDELLKYF
jgi:hypothetical protein